MFVRGLMVFFSVMRRRSLVCVRRKVVKFRSSLVRIFWHILLSNPSGWSAASTVFFDGASKHDCTSLKKSVNAGSTTPSPSSQRRFKPKVLLVTRLASRAGDKTANSSSGIGMALSGRSGAPAFPGSAGATERRRGWCRNEDKMAFRQTCFSY